MSSERAVLVSGDGHLTVLADHLPVRTPADFLAALDYRAPDQPERIDSIGQARRPPWAAPRGRVRP